MSSQNLRVVIADDERPARQRLLDLTDERDDVNVVATCSTGREAVSAIEDHDPDVVLLDVQMPGLTGFDVVQAVGAEAMPLTIFITAYDQHALKAFDVAAIDYLLKPFEDQRFHEALDRARRHIHLEAVDAARDRLLDLLDATGKLAGEEMTEMSGTGEPRQSGDGYLERIPVRKAKEIRIVPSATVAYVKSDGPYAELHTADGSKHLIRESMKSLEQQLDPSQFCRIHRSTIINLDFVESVEPNYNDRYVVRLVTGERLDVSRRRRDTFEDRFGLSF
ncbi:DNA-binding response regulator [Longibacter salinarum]|uniref:DNA-binding response regulator n=1 Tax=Longibacter salinarum TaxID=1850348 RepID=A0A2A8CYT9_9BACT|nr:LytTR family DNA-binding domain-containing protein [Longibacter salinarum]PEN13774.1 DNA-binding response regulator [Longibacter salinarum]